MAPSTLSSHMVRCLAWLLYYEGKEIVVEWASAQRQRRASDYGAFAIAFATELCWGFNPSSRLYNQFTLRQNIADCFSKRVMTPLSSKQKSVAETITQCKSYKVYCLCRQPWFKDEDMAQCSKCREWYHRHHANIPSSCFGRNTAFVSCNRSTNKK